MKSLKGMKFHGSHSRTSKLTEAQAQQILDGKGTMTTEEMAKKFGVSKPTVYNIQSRRIWRHLKPSASPQSSPTSPGNDAA